MIVVNSTTVDGKKYRRNSCKQHAANSRVVQTEKIKKLSKTSCIADGKLYYINRKAHGRKEPAMSKSALQNIVNDMTSKQPARRNNRWSEGWRINSDNWDGRVTLTNVKTGEEYHGRKAPLKSGGWSKKVEWQ